MSDNLFSDESDHGYHKASINKGEYGRSSKIQEEIEELVDAEKQQNKIMVLNELSDILSAVNGYVEYNFRDITFKDLLEMAESTNRAFKNGERSS